MPPLRRRTLRPRRWAGAAYRRGPDPCLRPRRLIFSSIKKGGPGSEPGITLSVAGERGGAKRDSLQLAFPAQPLQVVLDQHAVEHGALSNVSPFVELLVPAVMVPSGMWLELMERRRRLAVWGSGLRNSACQPALSPLCRCAGPVLYPDVGRFGRPQPRPVCRSARLACAARADAGNFPQLYILPRITACVTE